MNLPKTTRRLVVTKLSSNFGQAVELQTLPLEQVTAEQGWKTRNFMQENNFIFGSGLASLGRFNSGSKRGSWHSGDRREFDERRRNARSRAAIFCRF